MTPASAMTNTCAGGLIAARSAPARRPPRRRRARRRSRPRRRPTTAPAPMRTPCITAAPVPTWAFSPTTTAPDSAAPGAMWTKAPSTQSWSTTALLLTMAHSPSPRARPDHGAGRDEAAGREAAVAATPARGCTMGGRAKPALEGRGLQAAAHGGVADRADADRGGLDAGGAQRRRRVVAAAHRHAVDLARERRVEDGHRRELAAGAQRLDDHASVTAASVDHDRASHAPQLPAGRACRAAGRGRPCRARPPRTRGRRPAAGRARGSASIRSVMSQAASRGMSSSTCGSTTYRPVETRWSNEGFSVMPVSRPPSPTWQTP